MLLKRREDCIGHTGDPFHFGKGEGRRDDCMLALLGYPELLVDILHFFRTHASGSVWSRALRRVGEGAGSPGTFHASALGRAKFLIFVNSST